MSIKMLRPDGKDGVSVSDKIYFTLQNFVLDVLSDEDEMTLPALIVKASIELPAEFTCEIGFTMLQLKNDLLARHLIQQIKSDNPKNKIPVLMLKSKKRKTNRPSVVARMTIL